MSTGGVAVLGIYICGAVVLTALWRHELGSPPHAMRGVMGDALAVLLGALWPLVLAFSLAMHLAKRARPRGDSDG